MSSKSTAVFCLVFATCVVLSSASKYEKDINRVDRGPEDIEPKFKHKQVNKVWEKALRKNLHSNKLNDLQKQLKKIDEKYVINKKERLSPDVSPEHFKEQERIIDGLLEDVMMKFDIIPSRDGIFGGGNFRDRRIADLWASALKSEQFSKEELDILRKDLEEHQRKVEDFQAALQDHRKPSKLNKAPHENEIGDAKEKQDPIQQRAADIDMKLKHRDLTQNFQRLSVQVIPEEERGGFTDHKVIQLWQEAVKSNFDPEELEELRQELISSKKRLNVTTSCTRKS